MKQARDLPSACCLKGKGPHGEKYKHSCRECMYFPQSLTMIDFYLLGIFLDFW